MGSLSKGKIYSIITVSFLLCQFTFDSYGQFFVQRSNQVGLSSIDVCVIPRSSSNPRRNSVSHVTEVPPIAANVKGKGALTLTLHGENLETYTEFEVYINGRKTSAIEAVPQPIRRGTKGLRSRSVTLYLKRNFDLTKNYKLAYRHNIKSKNVFTKDYMLSKR